MDELDVKDFGAKGDGLTNDRAAIQRAIDACPLDGTVIIPDGVYRIDNDPLRLRKSIVLRHDDYYQTILLRGQRAPAVIDMTTGSIVGLEIRLDARSNFRKGILCHDFEFAEIIDCTFTSGTARAARTDAEWTNHAIYAHSGRDLRIAGAKLHNTQIKLGGGAGGIRGVLVDSIEAWEPVQYAVSVVARKAGAVIEDVVVEGVQCHGVRGSGVVYVGDDEGENPDLDIEVSRIGVHDIFADGDVKDGQCKLVHLRPAGTRSTDWALSGLRWEPSRRGKGSQGVTCFPRSEYDSLQGLHIDGLSLGGAGVDLAGLRIAGNVSGIYATGLDLGPSRGIDIRGSANVLGPRGRIADMGGAPVVVQAVNGPVGPLALDGTNGPLDITATPPHVAQVIADGP